MENSRGMKVEVLDLCSGKGGDLLKWKKGRIDYLVCAGRFMCMHAKLRFGDRPIQRFAPFCA